MVKLIPISISYPSSGLFHIWNYRVCVCCWCDFWNAETHYLFCQHLLYWPIDIFKFKWHHMKTSWFLTLTMVHAFSQLHVCYSIENRNCSFLNKCIHIIIAQNQSSHSSDTKKKKLTVSSNVISLHWKHLILTSIRKVTFDCFVTAVKSVCI